MYHANIQGVYLQTHHRSTTKDFGIKKKEDCSKNHRILLQLNLVKTPETSAQQK
jgi:hypothetical protein